MSINTVTKILDRWIDTHPTYGIRPLMQRLIDLGGLDDGDEETLVLPPQDPAGVLFPLSVYNDVVDESVATRYEPAEVPALVVVGEFSAGATPRKRPGVRIFEDVGFNIAYMERDQPVNLARQRGGYVAEMLDVSMLAFDMPQLADVSMGPGLQTWREWGRTKVLKVDGVRESRVTGGVGSSTLIGSYIGRLTYQRRTLFNLEHQP